MPETTQEQRDATARAVSARMQELDEGSRTLGITVAEVGDGWATMTMRVRPDMANSQGVCHGGFLFSLADTAFGHAANGQDDKAVIAQASSDFLRPALLGSVLTATARRVHQGRLLGTYDVEVHDEQQRLVLVVRAKSCKVEGHVTR